MFVFNVLDSQVIMQLRLETQWSHLTQYSSTLKQADWQLKTPAGWVGTWVMNQIERKTKPAGRWTAEDWLLLLMMKEVRKTGWLLFRPNRLALIPMVVLDLDLELWLYCDLVELGIVVEKKMEVWARGQSWSDQVEAFQEELKKSRERSSGNDVWL